MTTPWNNRYALRMKRMGSSVIRELLKLAAQPDIISFGGGLPAPELFPVEAFDAATSRVLSKHGSQALQYSTTEGYLPLREYIVDHMARYGISANPDNILITSGSQQALDLIGKVLINPGDSVLTEVPTYIGALQAWNAYQADFVTVPTDDDGIQTEFLAEALATGPKFMYILPNFQNPGGTTLALDRRQTLISAAEHYGIPIVEDDPYGQLRFEGDHLPPLVVIDSQRHCDDNGSGYFCGNVIYMSTFSKTLAPGLRLGWIVAPTEVISRCVMAKQGMDLHSSSFVQMIAYEVIRDGFLDQHVRRIREVYRERRDVMLAAMEEHFPEGSTWTRPKGGLFLWATLPEGLDVMELLPRAIANKVAFVPGTAFYPFDGGHRSFRLNFSNAQPDKIVVGIERLGDVIKAELASRQPQFA